MTTDELAAVIAKTIVSSIAETQAPLLEAMKSIAASSNQRTESNRALLAGLKALGAQLAKTGALIQALHDDIPGSGGRTQ
jgi:hypothetical protein